MSGASAQRSRENRGAKVSASGRQGVILPQRGTLGAIVLNQVDNLNHLGEVEVVKGAEILDNLPRAAYKGLRRKKDVFVLKAMADSFQFPSGHRLLVSIVTDKAAYPHLGFVAISRHHMLAGLRFPIPRFLIDVLNFLKLALMQLTPSLYGQLLTLYLLFRRNRLPPSSDNVIKYCFTMRQCPLPKGLLEEAFHDGMHHLVVWASEYRELL
ncbi:hypothetical protein ACOSQ3_014280 [Xanthoceras sorbifolium]